MRCLDTLLPALAEDFGHSIGSTGAAASAYALSYSVFQLLHGPLGDRAGTFRVVTVATCLSAVAALGCALAPSLSALVALRFVAGAIAAAIGPLTLAWVSINTAQERRAVVLARMTAAAILGTAAGQGGAGVLGGILGWHAVFAALAALFAVAGATLLMRGRGTAGADRDASRGTAGAARSRHALALLRRGAVRRVLAVVAVEGFAVYLSLTYIGGLLNERLHANPARVGLIVSLFGAGGIAFVVLAPRIVGRLKTRGRAAAGGILLGVGFGTLGCSATEEGTAASLFAIGFGFLMLHNALQVKATCMAPDALATSMSLFAASSCLSQAFGAACGGYVYDRLGPTAGIWTSAILLTALGVTIAIRSRRRSRRSDGPRLIPWTDAPCPTRSSPASGWRD